MKKILAMAVLMVASATVTTATAAKKDKKKKGSKITALKPVELKNGIDSLSYALGLSQSRGLRNYLAEQMKVDTTNISPFVEGLLEAANTTLTEDEAARFAGHAIGLQMARNIMPSMEKEMKAADENNAMNRNAFISAFIGGLENTQTMLTHEQAQKVSREKMKELKEMVNLKNKKAGEDFLAANASKEGVVTLPSGLQYKVLKEGTGAVPKNHDKVRVIYEGRLIDGTVFDASARHDGKGLTFKPNQVIKGWTEALTMMPVGSKWQLFIPQNLAYGERAAGKDIKPYSTLIFEVELMGIENDDKDAGKNK